MNGLELVQKGLSVWRQYHGNESLEGLCQRWDGWYIQWTWMGNGSAEPKYTYASANIARQNGRIVSTRINDTSMIAGARCYWYWGQYGHVCSLIGFDNGRALVSNTANTGDTVIALSNHVKISHADTLNLEWAGWSLTDGQNPQITGITLYGASLAPNQRQSGPNGANARTEPNTKNPPTSNSLKPNTVGTFDGWINGETVDGNKVWFRGANSGDFFWSGGFTDKGTHDLANLNSTTAPNQRVAGANGANGRNDPSTQGPVVGTIAPGATGTFNGWINGEAVDGNKVWFRQTTTNQFYWSGGFTDTGTHDLANLNPPPVSLDRTVGVNPANIRAVPWTSSPATGSSPGGSVVKMKAWTNADPVDDNDVWFQRDADGQWQWSGGFTSTSTEGLTKVTAPPKPTPPDPDNPRGLPEYPPVYPHAVKGLEAPLGFKNDGSPALRDTQGSPPQPVEPIIDRFIIHHTGTTKDQLDYFSYKNDRSSCPTWYVRTTGECFEMIRPLQKPASTGADWNWRSVAVEVQDNSGAPNWDITPESREQVAQIAAWLAEYDGSQLDGVPVEFKIDRFHIIGHNEAIPGTECPGPDMDLEWIVERAQEIYDEAHPPDPGPEDYYIVDRVLGDRIRRLVNRAFPPTTREDRGA